MGNTFKNINKAVEQNRQLILGSERYIWEHPETGFNEWKTQEYLVEEYKKLGYKLNFAGDIPGFYTDIDTGRPGPKVLILGEMDALICDEHPECDKKTKAVHACGHHAQSAVLLGIAAALTLPEMTKGLCGNIRLCAVPAEELIEIESREELCNQGIISFYGGKTEFMARGYFDDIDIAFMFHTGVGSSYSCGKGTNGCITKKIIYSGYSAHAGSAPHNGINALYAATLGLQAVNSLRETFKESDCIRFHPIITKGGDAVNIIPSNVVIESYVRGASINAIIRENKKINRALTGAALAMGCKCAIHDRPGYFPLTNDNELKKAAEEAMGYFLPCEQISISDKFGTGCTDMGDLSAVMPVIHPNTGGANGIQHGKNYKISDPELACITSAKIQLMLLHILLKDGASRANKIISEYKPDFKSAKEYISFLKSITRDIEGIRYYEDGAKTEFSSDIFKE